MRHIILILVAFSSFVLKAQIGYQVTILDTATGEPRANETISATITISGGGGAICSEVKTATTDEFGVLSLEVGNSSTFANVDWTKLPLYISATVDGVLIGRTQVLSVPVAEYAKQTGALTKNILCGRTWSGNASDGFPISISFSSSGSFSYTGLNKSISGHYGLCGNTVGLENCGVAVYIPDGGILQFIGIEKAALH
ncbi:MAG: hypothetical protein Q4F93_05935 [bacterium]|nr:hypothetical protein [bacterium]